MDGVLEICRSSHRQRGVEGGSEFKWRSRPSRHHLTIYGRVHSEYNSHQARSGETQLDRLTSIFCEPLLYIEAIRLSSIPNLLY